MDATRFDAFARALSSAGTRRGLLHLLAALPVTGGLAALLGEESEAGRRRRRKARHDPGGDTDTRKGKRKGKDKGKKKCKPESTAQTCAGNCATVTNNCGGQVDCGPCTCASGCPACQTCRGGQCVAANQGQVCGTSTSGGTALRCCNGACPDPFCLPSALTGVACTFPAFGCTGLNCCAQQGAVCVGPQTPGQCFCSFAEAGEPCGSDHDCSEHGGPETACICGACQAPPS